MFPNMLRNWRHKRRLSQLDLALSCGVSQRHLSFLESGRAKPSRDMILQLSETLDVPLRDRNEWLTAAGFAPVFKTRPLDDPQMSQVTAAVERMLKSHEPFPAAAVDRAWNVRMSNAPFDRMLAMLLGSEAARETNLMRLVFDPEHGVQRYIANWKAIAPLLWSRARREAETLGGADMKQVLAELEPLQDPEVLWSGEDAALVPVMPLEFERMGTRISLFTVIATFGTPQDVTADELRIEFFFPADESTAAIFRALR